MELPRPKLESPFLAISCLNVDLGLGFGKFKFSKESTDQGLRLQLNLGMGMQQIILYFLYFFSPFNDVNNPHGIQLLVGTEIRNKAHLAGLLGSEFDYFPLFFSAFSLLEWL